MAPPAKEGIINCRKCLQKQRRAVNVMKAHHHPADPNPP